MIAAIIIYTIFCLYVGRRTNRFMADETNGGMPPNPITLLLWGLLTPFIVGVWFLMWSEQTWWKWMKNFGADIYNKIPETLWAIKPKDDK